MGPSTFPSICRSSVPVMCPLICRLAPRRAEPRAGLLIGGALDGLLKATTAGFAACAGADGDSAWACCLVHIVCSLCGCRFELRVGGATWIQCRPLTDSWQSRTETGFRGWKLAARTGRHNNLRTQPSCG